MNMLSAVILSLQIASKIYSIVATLYSPVAFIDFNQKLAYDEIINQRNIWGDSIEIEDRYGSYDYGIYHDDFHCLWGACSARIK